MSISTESAAPPHLKFGIGQPVSRKEDPKLLTGRGRYSDDVDLPGQAHAVVLRSPVAHGILRRTEPLHTRVESAQLRGQVLYDCIGSELYEPITEQPEYYPTRAEDGLLAHLQRLIASGHDFFSSPRFSRNWIQWSEA